MAGQPILESQRLRLRPLSLEDATDVQRLAGEREIAATTRLIPHPYEDGVAQEWISSLPGKFDREEQATFAITDKKSNALMGCIGLVLAVVDNRAELGYWIGKPYWGQGFCTEAAQIVLTYGFQQRKLHRIFAHHMASNPASGKVLEKLGMKHEGMLRQHNLKWGKFEDIHIYGILKSEFLGAG